MNEATFFYVLKTDLSGGLRLALPPTKYATFEEAAEKAREFASKYNVSYTVFQAVCHKRPQDRPVETVRLV